MFVDASALLAMLLDENEARILAARLERAPTRLTSPVAVFETIVGLHHSLGLEPAGGEATVAGVLELMGIKVIALPASVVPLAAAAFARFGASLTPPECLAYAAARAYRLPLLYRSAGFALTDVEPA